MNTIQFVSVRAACRGVFMASLLVTMAGCGGEQPAQTAGEAPAVDTAPPAADVPAQEMMEEVQEAAADAGAAVTESCAECHEAGSFAGRDAADVAAALGKIQAGEVKHPSLPADLSGEDLAKIAASLVAERDTAGL